MKRALVVCPGRGSYDRSCLGTLKGRGGSARAVIDACDAARRAAGRPTVSELDAAEAFRPALHLAGENASLLTFAAGLADLAELSRSAYEVVGVAGNSMGFYTALVASGALPLADGIRLVETMGAYQADRVIGGQVITPVCGDDWAPDRARAAAVEAALARARGQGASAFWSIRLGGFAVLGADEAGIAVLLRELPKETRSGREYPTRLPLHSAFHTPLMAETSRRALADLRDLAFGAPSVPLVDGRGFVWAPRWADPAALAHYTLSTQVLEPYDFTTSIRTALRHCGPDVVVALGPGNTLGGPLARILVEEGWRGRRTREAFEADSAADPVLASFGMPAQREALT